MKLVRHTSLVLLCLVYMYGYMVIGAFARELGAAGFVILIFFASFYLLYYRVSPPRSLMYLSAIAIIYSILSHYDFFQASWTIYYEKDFIFRQMICVPAFMVIYSAYADAVLRFREFFYRKNIIIYFVLLPVLSILAAQLQAGELVGLPNLIGPSVLIILGLGILVFQSSSKLTGLLVAFVACSLIVVASNNAQITLAALFIFLVYMTPRSEFGVYSATFAFLLTPFLIIYAYALVPLVDDPNTAIRLYIWRDALDLVRDSSGFGIGFGTELVRNYYESHTALSPFAEEDLLMISTHNTFVFFLARIGVVSLLLFVYFFLKIGFGIKSNGNLINSKIALLAWLIGMLSLTVNVAIESVVFLTATAFALAVAKGFQAN